jgi:Asp-tRNA(Asn)/Glu-tRNA(Gln) amidotransferase C subunit
VDQTRPELTDDLVADLARVARLDLSEERRVVAGGLLQLVHGLLDSLEELDLADVPPATAFDARWE